MQTQDPSDVPPDDCPDSRADDQTDMSRAIAALSSAISALRDRAEAAEQRADLAEQRIDVALSTLQKAGEALTAEQVARLAAETEAAQLRQMMDQVRVDADEAVRAAERNAAERITAGLGLLREAAENLAAERIARA